MTDSFSAEQRALAILKKAPGQPEALALLISARRLANDLRGARDLLWEMTKAAPNLASTQYELGLVLQELGEHDESIAALCRVVNLEPMHATGWRALADVLSKEKRTAATQNTLNFRRQSWSNWKWRRGRKEASLVRRKTACGNG